MPARRSRPWRRVRRRPAREGPRSEETRFDRGPSSGCRCPALLTLLGPFRLLRLGSLRLLFHRFDRDQDLDVVPEERPSLVERLVPEDSEVLPVELAAHVEASAVVPPWILHEPPQLDIQC